MGQSIDLLTARLRTPDGRVDVSKFDMKRYQAIVKYKTSYYSFVLPIVLGMRMVGKIYFLCSKKDYSWSHLF